MNDVATLRQHWPAPTMRRPIVIFGAGSIVRDAHLPAYAKGGYEIAGIYDPDHKKAATLGHRAFGLVEEAAAVDGAVFDLATPPAAHADILAVLPESAPALIQKPMGMDLADATRILQVCRQRKLLAAVNFQLRFAPMMVALRDAVARGWLGEIVDVEMHAVMATPWSLWAFLDGLPGSRSRCIRSIISTASACCWAILRVFTQRPWDILRIRSRRRGHRPFWITATKFVARCRSIMTGISVARIRPAKSEWPGPRARRICNWALIWTIPRANRISCGSGPRGAIGRTSRCKARWFPDAFTGRMHNLQRAAGGEEDLISPVADSWKTMALVEAAYASSRQPATPIESLP